MLLSAPSSFEFDSSFVSYRFTSYMWLDQTHLVLSVLSAYNYRFLPPQNFTSGVPFLAKKKS